MTAAEVEPAGMADPSLSEDALCDMIGPERRREVVRILDAERKSTINELTAQLATLENERPEDELSSQQKKRVYVSLYQTHLPKMDEAGVIVYDVDEGSVSRGEHFVVVAEVVAAIDGAQDDSDAGLIDRLLGGVFA